MSAKRLFIERVYDAAIALYEEGNPHDTSETPLIDPIDREVYINKMMEVCDMDVENLLLVEEFLNSPVYIKYQETLQAMGSAMAKQVIAGLGKERKLH